MSLVRAPRVTFALVLAALVATAVVVGVPGVRFAYNSPAGHAAVETAAGLIALLAAYLLLARFRLAHVGGELWLAAALAILGFSTLSFAVGPSLAGRPAGESLSWARVFAELAGVTLFAWAAWQSPQKVRDPAEHSMRAAMVVVSVLVLALATALTLGSALPAPVRTSLSPESSQHVRIVGTPLLECAQVLAAAALAAAAWGFMRRSRGTDDALYRWFATASMLGAFARVHYFLFPSLYSPLVHTGDFLRLAYHLVILVASIEEIARYQPRLARAAILDERRRIARDLHDGLAQEVAFIASGLRSFDDYPPTRDDIDQLLEAADHALLESRQAISALSSVGEEPLGIAVGRVARALAVRAGVDVRIDVDEGVDAAPQVREAVLRIVREAVTNALRHGHASSVAVKVSNGRGLRVAIMDDGDGFAPLGDELRDDALGLDSMRERAEAVGGRLVVNSSPGSGTVVEAILPR